MQACIPLTLFSYFESVFPAVREARRILKKATTWKQDYILREIIDILVQYKISTTKRG